MYWEKEGAQNNALWDTRVNTKRVRGRSVSDNTFSPAYQNSSDSVSSSHYALAPQTGSRVCGLVRTVPWVVPWPTVPGGAHLFSLRMMVFVIECGRPRGVGGGS